MNIARNRRGDLIWWRPEVQEGKGFTRSRTTEIEVYWLNHKEAALRTQDSRGEAVCKEEVGAVVKWGSEKVWGRREFSFWVPAPGCKEPIGQLGLRDIWRWVA